MLARYPSFFPPHLLAGVPAISPPYVYRSSEGEGYRRPFNSVDENMSAQARAKQRHPELLTPTRSDGVSGALGARAYCPEGLERDDEGEEIRP